MLVQHGGHDSAFLPEGFGASSNNNRLLRSVQRSAVEDEVTDSGSNDKQLMLVRRAMILLCSIMWTDHFLAHLIYERFGREAFRFLSS